KPVRFTGYYKYKAGDGDYIAPNGDVLPGVKDSCSVYSVFFKTDEKTSFLDGTNILSHPNVVAVAKLPDESRGGTPGDGFAYFDIPFEYYGNGDVDFKNNSYKLAVILSSSFYGDRYEGAPGSMLIVDNIDVITEKK
ncbi:MAG: PCMD domain-containing protein, partial [Tannerellaceae bacterium]|nr:PCMD domain-containing protein [Tannerellaceae bacterium]